MSIIKSDSIVKLAKAILAVQVGIDSAAKDATNPHFKSTFASLASVIDAVKKPLNDNGITVLQFPSDVVGYSSPSTDVLGLTTLLVHESGEYIGAQAIVPLVKSDPQAYGSAMTYARRYGLASILGLKTVDDDAEAAVGRQTAERENIDVPHPPVGKFPAKQQSTTAPARGKTGMFPKVTA